jgi:ABC-type uncharacterized transport system ATPase subunit
MVMKGSSASPIIRQNARVKAVSAANSANDEIGGLIVGTSVHQGTAANSLVLSNIDEDGDIQMLVRDGDHSKEFLLANGDTADLQLGHGMATATIKTASGDLTLSPGGTVISTKDIRSHAARPALQLSETDGSADQNWEIMSNSGVLTVSTQNDAFGSASAKLTITQAGVIGITGVEGSLASGVAKAWAGHNGAGTITAGSFNMTGTAKNSTGNYTWTFDTDFADANWCVGSTDQSQGNVHHVDGGSQAAGTWVELAFDGNTDSTAQDGGLEAAFFGDQ